VGDPITPVILAVNIGCGLATNLSQAGGATAYRRVAAVLSRGKPRENHDILKATHAAFVEAMETMAEASRRTAAGGTAQDREATRALERLCTDPAFRDFRYDGEHFPLAAVNEAIDRMFAGGLGEAGGSVRTDPDLALNRLIVADLAAWGVVLTPTLEQLFVHGSPDYAPWHATFRTAFAHQVKHNGTAFRILTFERLGELRSIGMTLIGEVDGIHDRLDRIEDMLRELLRRIPAAAPAGLGVALLGILVAVQLRTPAMLIPPGARVDESPIVVADSGPSGSVDIPAPAPGPAHADRAAPAEQAAKAARPAESDAWAFPWRRGMREQRAGRAREEDSAILAGRIRGLWGDRACAETYRIATDGRTSLIVVPEGRDAPPRVTRELTILRVSGDTAFLVAALPDGRRGETVTLSYSEQGGRERLVWSDRSEQRDVTLTRCD
jgi:hypothetical protein